MWLAHFLSSCESRHLEMGILHFHHPQLGRVGDDAPFLQAGEQHGLPIFAKPEDAVLTGSSLLHTENSVEFSSSRRWIGLVL